MTTNPIASLEKIGSRVLQTTMPLLKMPVRDEPLQAFRELTAIPTLRFSEMLEPFVGDEPERTGKNPDEAVHESDSSMVSAPSIKPANLSVPGILSTRTDYAGGDSKNIHAPQSFTGRSEMQEQRPVSPSLSTPQPEVSKVFQAMAVLNLFAAPHHKAGPEAQRTSRPATAMSPRLENALLHTADEHFRTPTTGHRNRNRSQEPVREQAHEPSGSSDETKGSSGRLPGESGVAATAAATGFRMAQGAPRIAALLQANFVGNDKNLEPVQLAENVPAVNSDESTGEQQSESHARRTGGMVDVDLLMEKLAEQLEFELMRTYGTSGR